MGCGGAGYRPCPQGQTRPWRLLRGVAKGMGGGEGGGVGVVAAGTRSTGGGWRSEWRGRVRAGMCGAWRQSPGPALWGTDGLRVAVE